MDYYYYYYCLSRRLARGGNARPGSVRFYDLVFRTALLAAWNVCRHLLGPGLVLMMTTLSTPTFFFSFSKRTTTWHFTFLGRTHEAPESKGSSIHGSGWSYRGWRRRGGLSGIYYQEAGRTGVPAVVCTRAWLDVAFAFAGRGAGPRAPLLGGWPVCWSFLSGWLERSFTYAIRAWNCWG